VGAALGLDVGAALGLDVGTALGLDVGAALGLDVGAALGLDVGAALGLDVGATDEEVFIINGSYMGADMIESLPIHEELLAMDDKNSCGVPESIFLL
jgi:hypothetical protein